MAILEPKQNQKSRFHFGGIEQKHAVKIAWIKKKGTPWPSILELVI